MGYPKNFQNNNPVDGESSKGESASSGRINYDKLAKKVIKTITGPASPRTLATSDVPDRNMRDPRNIQGGLGFPDYKKEDWIPSDPAQAGYAEEVAERIRQREFAKNMREAGPPPIINEPIQEGPPVPSQMGPPPPPQMAPGHRPPPPMRPPPAGRFGMPPNPRNVANRPRPPMRPPMRPSGMGRRRG
jgi:hypothetical protein